MKTNIEEVQKSEFTYEILLNSNIFKENIADLCQNNKFDEEEESQEKYTASTQRILKNQLLELQYLKKIKYIFPSNCKLEDELNRIKDLYKFLPNLNTLELCFGQDDKIQLNELKILGNLLTNLNNLIDLSIIFNIENQLDIQVLQNMKEIIIQLKRIENFHLFIPNSEIKEEGMIIISDMISYLTNLKGLSLIIGSHNNLNIKGAISLGNSIQKLNNLAQLTLTINNDNQIFAEGAISLIKSLQQLKNLKQLSINIFGDDPFSEQVLQEIYSCFQELKQLTNLTYIINGEYMTNTIANILGDQLHNLYNLTLLKVCVGQVMNKQNEHVISPIQGKLFQGLSNLKQLDLTLDSNRISQEGLQFIGQSLSNLVHIQILKILIKSQYTMIQDNFLRNLSQFQNLSNLRLEIHDAIQENLLEDLENSICGLTNLNSLSMKFMTTFKSTKSITKFITGLQKLKNLNSIEFKTLMHLEKYSVVGNIHQRNQVKMELINLFADQMIQLSQIQYINLKIESSKSSNYQKYWRKCKRLVYLD